MSDYNFNAPQYIEFTSPVSLNKHLNIEGHFDLEHENRECYIEPVQICLEESLKLRRSASAGALNLLTKKPEQDCNISSTLENLHQPQVSVVTTPWCETGPKISQKHRSISSDALELPYIKPQKRKTYPENLRQNKYISFAEAVRKFQTATPPRFRRTAKENPLSGAAPLQFTVPQSPMLSTKMRARPVLDYISKDQQMELEADEMKKYKIKARPLNYEILKGALLVPNLEKKAITVPQPFHLTEVKQQMAKPEEPRYEFRAKPAPVSTITRPLPIVKPSPKPTTKPKTPSFMAKHKERYVCAFSENIDPNANPTAKNIAHLKEVASANGEIPKQLFNKPVTRTVLEPFSFEERDKMLQRRKEEKTRKVLEEEKKLKVFHARPIPKTVSSIGKVESKIGNLISEGSGTSLKNCEKTAPSTITDAENIFKARPATVIHQRPFIPKIEHRLLEVQEFQLNSQRRALERLEFDRKLKEKEEKIEQLRKENEENLKMQEDLEVLKLRKELVHRANPIKQYKPVEIQPSVKKLTSPKSPLVTKRYKNDS